MDKKKLAELLGATLPVNADRIEVHAFIRNQQKLINFLANSLAVQGRSILQLRSQMVDVEVELGIKADEEPLIVGVDKPKLVIPGVN